MLGPLQCYFLSLLSCLRPLTKNRIDVPCGTYARSLKMADRRRSFMGKLSSQHLKCRDSVAHCLSAHELSRLDVTIAGLTECRITDSAKREIEDLTYSTTGSYALQ